MYYKTLSVLLLSATAAVAVPQEENNYSDVQNYLSSTAIPTNLDIPDIPSSVAEVVATAVPTSFIQEIITDTDARSSVVQGFASGQYPDWYSSIPNDVQSFISDYVTSAEAATTADATSTSSGSASESTAAESTAAESTPAESSGAESATSDSGAPVQTGAMAASLAGAAGVLGLAFAL